MGISDKSMLRYLCKMYLDIDRQMRYNITMLGKDPPILEAPTYGQNGYNGQNRVKM